MKHWHQKLETTGPMTNEQHDANQIENSHKNAQGAQELLSSNVKTVRSRHQINQVVAKIHLVVVFVGIQIRQRFGGVDGWIHVDDGVMEVVVEEERYKYVISDYR